MSDLIERDSDLDLDYSGGCGNGVTRGMDIHVAACPKNPDVFYRLLSDGVIEITAAADIKLVSAQNVVIESANKVSVQTGDGMDVLGDLTVMGNITASGEITDHERSMSAGREIYNLHNHPPDSSTPGVMQ